MQLRSYDRRSVVFLVLGTLLFGWVLFGWWQKDYMNPDKVFKDMLSYSMNTYGYTKIIEQKNEFINEQLIKYQEKELKKMYHI